MPLEYSCRAMWKIFLVFTYLESRWEQNQQFIVLHWRHSERDGVLNHRRLDCLLNRLSWRRSKKTSKLRVIGLCEGNASMTNEFLAQTGH